MAKKRAKFTYTPELIPKPIIYELSKRYNVITNIRRANVDERQGWVVLELEGDEDEINKGLKWVQDQGVRVDPVVGDIVEG